MRDLVGAEDYVLVLEKCGAKHIPQSVVFFIEGENGGVGGAGIRCPGKFLFIVTKEEELETGGGGGEG